LCRYTVKGMWLEKSKEIVGIMLVNVGNFGININLYEIVQQTNLDL